MQMFSNSVRGDSLRYAKTIINTGISLLAKMIRFNKTQRGQNVTRKSATRKTSVGSVSTCRKLFFLSTCRKC